MRCSHCNSRVPSPLRSDGEVCNCPTCGKALDLPEGTDLLRICILRSGVCPNCGDDVFEFRTQGSLLFECPRCSAVTSIVIKPEEVFHYLATLISKRETSVTVQPSDSHSDTHGGSEPSAPLQWRFRMLEKKFLKALAGARTMEEIQIVLACDFLEYTASENGFGATVNQATRMMWVTLIKLTLTLVAFANHSLEDTLGLLESLLKQAVDARDASLVATILGLKRSLSACHGQHTNPPTDYLTARMICPTCNCLSLYPIYRIVSGETLKRKSFETLNVVACPDCGFMHGRVMPFLLVVDQGKMEVVAFFRPGAQESEEYAKCIASYFSRFSDGMNGFSFREFRDYSRFCVYLEDRPLITIRVMSGELGCGLQILRAMGCQYYLHEEYERSEMCYRASVKFDRGCPENWKGLAAALAAQGKLAEAQRALELAGAVSEEEDESGAMPSDTGTDAEPVDSVSRLPDTSAGLTQALFECIAEYDESYLASFPKEQEVGFFLASAYRSLNDRRRFIIMALRAIAIDPVSQWAQMTWTLLALTSKNEIAEHVCDYVMDAA